MPGKPAGNCNNIKKKKLKKNQGGGWGMMASMIGREGCLRNRRRGSWDTSGEVELCLFVLSATRMHGVNWGSCITKHRHMPKVNSRLEMAISSWNMLLKYCKTLWVELHSARSGYMHLNVGLCVYVCSIVIYICECVWVERKRGVPLPILF